MGWDITYHPIAASEIQTIYFAGLKDPSLCQKLVDHFEVNEFYAEQLALCFEEARNIKKEVPFNLGHAFYIAMISGFLRKHDYLRGAAFSFFSDDARMVRYMTDWKSLVPVEYQDYHFDNWLTENYCGGVFIAHADLKALREDYRHDAHVKAKMDEVFSHGRLEVFWAAVDNAIKEGTGLLEAAEIVEPDPLDLNKSRSKTNLFNCNPEGPLLYQKAVLEQLSEIKEQNPPEDTQATTEEKKKGFFSKLFGK